jgi:hypothetical protein
MGKGSVASPALPLTPPMPAGPAGSSLSGPLAIELAPDLDLTIGAGDILDY